MVENYFGFDSLVAAGGTLGAPGPIYDSNALMTNDFYKAARLDTSKANYWLQLYGRTPLLNRLARRFLAVGDGVLTNQREPSLLLCSYSALTRLLLGSYSALTLLLLCFSV